MFQPKLFSSSTVGHPTAPKPHEIHNIYLKPKTIIFPNSPRPLGTSPPPAVSSGSDRLRGVRARMGCLGRRIGPSSCGNARRRGQGTSPTAVIAPPACRLHGTGMRRPRLARTRRPPARHGGEVPPPRLSLLPPPRSSPSQLKGPRPGGHCRSAGTEYLLRRSPLRRRAMLPGPRGVAPPPHLPRRQGPPRSRGVSACDEDGGRRNASRSKTEASLINLMWWVDGSYGVHWDSKGHTGAMMSMGKGAIVNVSRRHKLNVESSTESELVSIADVLGVIIWYKYLLS